MRHRTVGSFAMRILLTIIFCLGGWLCPSLWGQDLALDWLRSQGGTGPETVSGLVIDPAGALYLCGTFTGTVDFDPSAGTQSLTAAGGHDIFVQKLDSNGQLLWVYQLGSPGDERAADLALDPSGSGLLLLADLGGSVDVDPGLGTTIAQPSDGRILVHKVDTAGQLVWARQLANDNPLSQGQALAVSSSGEVYLTGAFGGTGDFDPGPLSLPLSAQGSGSDIFLQKLTASGDLDWAYAYGGTPDGERGVDVTVDSLGEGYFIGEYGSSFDFDPGAGALFLPPAGAYSVFVVKFGAEGAFRWARQVRDQAAASAELIHFRPPLDLYCVSRFRSTVDADPGADTLAFTSVVAPDLLVQRLDTSGLLVWARQLAGKGEKRSHDLLSLPNGDLVLTGRFRDSLDLDPGAGIYWLVSDQQPGGGYSDDMFLTVLRANGSFAQARQGSSEGPDRGSALGLSPLGTLYQAGTFASTATFDAFNSGLTATAAGSSDIFVGQWNSLPSLPVYPGDANYDSMANFLDILPLGVAFGSLGPSRPSASLSWTPQSAPDWQSQYGLTGADYKHSDTDGDGLVGFDDTLALTLNRGQFHGLPSPAPVYPPTLTGNAPLHLIAPSVMLEGDTVALRLHLGTSDSIASQIYALAVELSYDTSSMDILYTHWDSSWLGIKDVNLITFAHEDSLAAQHRIAMSRTDGTPFTGYGQVATIIVVISDDIAKRGLALRMQWRQVLAINAQGQPLAVRASGVPFELGTDTTLLSSLPSGAQPFCELRYLPGQSVLALQSATPLSGCLHLYDPSGRLLSAVSLQHTLTQRVSLAHLPSGLYLIQVASLQHGLMTRRLWVR